MATALRTYEDLDDLNREIQRQNETNWVEFPPDLKAFAYAYLEHYNHRKAATSIDRNPDQGISLIRDPMISSFISYILEKRAMPNIISADFVRSQYLQLLPKLLGEEEVPMIVDGTSIDALKFHSNEVISVLRELGKSTKFYEDGSGQSGQVQVNLNFGNVLPKDIPEVTIVGSEVIQGEID